MRQVIEPRPPDRTMRIPGHETCHSEVIAIVDSELMTIKNPADFATGDRHQLGMSDFSSSESAVKVRLAPVNPGHSWGLGGTTSEDHSRSGGPQPYGLYTFATNWPRSRTGTPCRAAGGWLASFYAPVRSAPEQRVPPSARVAANPGGLRQHGASTSGTCRPSGGRLVDHLVCSLCANSAERAVSSANFGNPPIENANT